MSFAGIVLMDIRMPNLDGLEATRRILDTTGTAPRVLMLTTFDLDEYVYEALPRPAPAASCSRTRRPSGSSRRSTSSPPEMRSLSPAITKRVIEEVHPPAAEHDRDDSLTACCRPDRARASRCSASWRGLSNAEIARDLFVSETTVKTHVARI